MPERKPLNHGDELSLTYRRDGKARERYEIVSIIGQGSSSICYEALRYRNGKRETGRLKEFYPLLQHHDQAFSYVKRLESNRLVPLVSYASEYEKQAEEYIQGYMLLEDLYAASSKNEVLKNYIQYGEILFFPARAEEEYTSPELRALCLEKPGYYIWYPGEKGINYQDFLQRLHRHANRRSAYKILQILEVICSLADCVYALHAAGLINLDLSLNNFLIRQKSDGSIQRDGVSIIDINTARMAGSLHGSYGGTIGFMAPELKMNKCSNRSDVYSLACVLYSSLVCENKEAKLYDPRRFGRIGQDLQHSELFQDLPDGARTLISRLGKLLSKSLQSAPRNRLRSVLLFLEEIQQIRDYWNRKIQEPLAKKKASTDAKTILQEILYKIPLLPAKGSQSLNVLVFGDDETAFLYTCLLMQSVQIPHCLLHVKLLSEDPARCRQKFLAGREALEDFIKIDGSRTSQFLPYAVLDFETINGWLDPADHEQNIQKIQEYLQDQPDVDAVFFAAGNDSFNEKTARIFKDILENAKVFYTTQRSKKITSVNYREQFFPVSLKKPVVSETINAQMMQMATNTHSIWARTSVQSEELLSNLYYFGSSISYALSIPYKLAEYLDQKLSLMEAARQLAQSFQDDPGLLREYVELERHRWVLEKVCDGWKVPRTATGEVDLQLCLKSGALKDEEKKLHLALVHTRTDSPLRSYSRQEWNQISERDDLLDELDTISVELHRAYLASAQDNIHSGLIEQALERIEALLKMSQASLEEPFFILQRCVFQLMYFKMEAALSWDRILSDFRNRIQNEQLSYMQYLLQELDSLSVLLRPVQQAILCKDYKENDLALVENLPYIITSQKAQALRVKVDENLDVQRLYLLLCTLYPTRVILQEKQPAVFPGLKSVLASRLHQIEIESVPLGPESPSMEISMENGCFASFEMDNSALTLPDGRWIAFPRHHTPLLFDDLCRLYNVTVAHTSQPAGREECELLEEMLQSSKNREQLEILNKAARESLQSKQLAASLIKPENETAQKQTYVLYHGLLKSAQILFEKLCSSEYLESWQYLSSRNGTVHFLVEAVPAVHEALQCALEKIAWFLDPEFLDFEDQGDHLDIVYQPLHVTIAKADEHLKAFAASLQSAGLAFHVRADDQLHIQFASQNQMRLLFDEEYRCRSLTYWQLRNLEEVGELLFEPVFLKESRNEAVFSFLYESRPYLCLEPDVDMDFFEKLQMTTGCILIPKGDTQWTFTNLMTYLN